MSVPKYKRKESKLQVFVNATRLRRAITQWCLRDFGIKSRVRKISNLFSAVKFLSEDIDMFYEHTINRIPWAALDKSEDYFILSAANKTNFKTNIFDTDIFKAKVLEIVNEQ